MKVFLISNTYSAHLIVSNLSFVTNGYVTELILLNEVIRHQDTLLNCDVPVKICDSIEDAMNSCDQIWIVSDGILSTKKFDQIKISANQENKVVWEFVDPWIQSNNSNSYELSRNPDLDTGSILPRIMLISFGKWTQLYSVEIFFTKMLLKKSANIFCEFSSPTKCFLKQLDEMGILNTEIPLSVSLDSSDVILQGIESKAFDYSEEGWKDAYSIFKSQADIVFLLLDGCFMNYDNIDEINKMFSYKCGILPDNIMISNFRELNLSESQCRYMKCIENRANKRQDMVSLNDMELLHAYEDSIVKITTPRGISWVNLL